MRERKKRKRTSGTGRQCRDAQLHRHPRGTRRERREDGGERRQNSLANTRQIAINPEGACKVL
jgi:hypothetical protein